jgi:hypothetical protein
VYVTAGERAVSYLLAGDGDRRGVVLAVVLQEGRPVGIAGHVQQREGWVYVWVGGLIARFTVYDIDEARAAAERLAQERE